MCAWVGGQAAGDELARLSDEVRLRPVPGWLCTCKPCTAGPLAASTQAHGPASPLGDTAPAPPHLPLLRAGPQDLCGRIARRLAPYAAAAAGGTQAETEAEALRPAGLIRSAWGTGSFSG